MSNYTVKELITEEKVVARIKELAEQINKIIAKAKEESRKEACLDY